jgi:hypothetical protein
LSIEGKLYQLEGLHPTSIDNNITSIDHHNHHQTFSESKSDSTYCKTDDDDIFMVMLMVLIMIQIMLLMMLLVIVFTHLYCYPPFLPPSSGAHRDGPGHRNFFTVTVVKQLCSSLPSKFRYIPIIFSYLISQWSSAEMRQQRQSLSRDA